MMVENAFGRLKARWRIVSKRMDCDVDLAPYVIMTCCCLHNLCEKLKTPLTQQQIDDASSQTDQLQPIADANQRVEVGAAQIRDAIKDHLANTQPLRTSIHY